VEPVRSLARVPVHDGQKVRIPGQRHDLNKCTLQAATPAAASHTLPRWPEPSRARATALSAFPSRNDITLRLRASVRRRSQRELRQRQPSGPGAQPGGEGAAPYRRGRSAPPGASHCTSTRRARTVAREPRPAARMRASRDMRRRPRAVRGSRLGEARSQPPFASVAARFPKDARGSPAVGASPSNTRHRASSATRTYEGIPHR
jgi:hypothetical protein